jgi:hypothetical protein
MEPLKSESPRNGWEALQQVGADLARFTEMIRGIQEASKALTQGVSQAVRNAIPVWDPQAFQALLEPLQATALAMNSLPDRTRVGVTKAALRGWFVGPELPIPSLTALETLEGEDIDALFVDHYRSHWEEVESWVSERFPARAPLLKEAFAAHREGRYALAIPVFLAQADGMCDEALGRNGHLFTGAPGRVQERARLLEELAAQEDSFFLDAILEPLKTALPSSIANKAWLESQEIFSRNAILHGMDLGYGTELNALRAISLVDYLVWALHDRGPSTV